jgi:hypothetical protein
MTKSIVFSLAVVLAASMSTLSFTGNTYYVGKKGNDYHSCLQAIDPSTPKLTIMAGISCLAGGDTLIIKSGTYNEIINITDSRRNGTSWADATRIVSETPRDAIITPPAGFFLAAIVVHGDNDVSTPDDPEYIEFDGLVLQGPNIDKQGGGGLHIDRGAKHIRFKNGVVKDFRGDINTVSCFGAVPDPITGKDLYFPANCEIIDSEFINNLSSNNAAGTGGGSQCFYISGGSFIARGNKVTRCWGVAFRVERADDPAIKTIIENNVLWDNDNIAIQVQTPGAIIKNNVVYSSAIHEWAGIRTLGDDISVLNNTVYGNRNGGIMIGTNFRAVKNNRVLNNIAVGNGAPFSDLALYGSGHMVDYNIIQKPIYNQASSVTVGPNNKMGIDPKFVHIRDRNFRLQPGSPAIDTGVSLSEVPTDFIGTSRSMGAAYDIGAFEFNGTP